MMTVLKTIRTLVLLPFAIVVGTPVFLVMVIIILAHMPRTIWLNHCWRSKLHRDGRYRNPAIKPESIDAGTLIVDSPTVGWAITQCWWTPENILDLAPDSIPSADERDRYLRSNPDRLELPFDRWVSARYLDANAGTAILLGYRRGDAVARRITNRVDIPVVKSWSGPIAQFPNKTQDGG